MPPKETQAASSGSDSVTAPVGDQTVAGAAGDDSVTAAAGNDTITATEGDTVTASEPHPADAGAAGNDAITAEPEPSTLPPHGMAKLRPPKGGTGASWGGQSYDVDEEGFLTVPLAAVADLTSHGFELV